MPDIKQSIEGKIALVTGAGRGIGRACAIMLAGHGATVYITARSKDQLADVASVITNAGGKVVVVPGDLTEDAFVEALFDQIEKESGRIDIVVNSAGIAPFGSVDDLSVQKFRDGMELNVLALYGCTRRAILLMKKNGSVGKIQNIASVCGHWACGGGHGYVSTKFAVRAMTECIAREMAAQKLEIAVGCISPGLVDTPLTNPNGDPKPEWLRPEQIAAAVMHAVTVPNNVNVFETTIIPTFQGPG